MYRTLIRNTHCRIITLLLLLFVVSTLVPIVSAADHLYFQGLTKQNFIKGSNQEPVIVGGRNDTWCGICLAVVYTVGNNNQNRSEGVGSTSFTHVDMFNTFSHCKWTSVSGAIFTGDNYMECYYKD